MKKISNTNTKHTLGIIAYGSLISEPGIELEPYITERINCITPFKVEYARTSKTRSGAPTLIPFEDGGFVQGCILVLSDNLDINEAKSMLWRRETRIPDKNYKHSENPSNNKVIVETIKGWRGFDYLLYTKIGSNIDGDITAKRLAQYAVNSILLKAGQDKKDGLRYLSDAIAAGILTPLTNDYLCEILTIAEVTTLSEAISKYDDMRIL